MGDVAGKGFVVEDAVSKGATVLPRCKGAATGWDGGKRLAESYAFLLSGICVFMYDEWLVSTAFRAGDL